MLLPIGARGTSLWSSGPCRRRRRQRGDPQAGSIEAVRFDRHRPGPAHRHTVAKPVSSFQRRIKGERAGGERRLLAFMDAGDPVNRCDGKMRRSCSIGKICWLRCSVMDRDSAPRDPGPTDTARVWCAGFRRCHALVNRSQFATIVARVAVFLPNDLSAGVSDTMGTGQESLRIGPGGLNQWTVTGSR